MKKGTPTMGGLIILVALVMSTLLWANLVNRYVWVVVLGTLAFGAHRDRGRLEKLRSPQGALGAREVRAAARGGARAAPGRVLATAGQRLGAGAGHSVLQGLAAGILAGGGSRSECW